MSQGFKRLSEGLGPLLSRLERRIEANVELAERVRQSLPGPEKDHVISATYRGETLVVLADAAVWCPRIRYAQQALFEALRAAGETRFTKLKVRVGRRQDPGDSQP
ncbi:MAG TPA: DciA family protein [Steroidobacteraceae bacterium]|jgi:hypothetical protein